MNKIDKEALEFYWMKKNNKVYSNTRTGRVQVYRTFLHAYLEIYTGHNTIQTFFFNSVLRPFSRFSSYETGQSVGGAKTGEPREKPPDTPASRTWLVSHVARAGLEPTPDTAVR